MNLVSIKISFFGAFLLFLLPSFSHAGRTEMELKKAGLRCIKEVLIKAGDYEVDQIDSEAERIYNRFDKGKFLSLTSDEKFRFLKNSPRARALLVVDNYEIIEATYRYLEKNANKKIKLYAEYALKDDLKYMDKIFMKKIVRPLLDEAGSGIRLNIIRINQNKALHSAKLAMLSYHKYRNKHYRNPRSIQALYLSPNELYYSFEKKAFLQWRLLPKVGRFKVHNSSALFIAPEPIGGKRVVGLSDGNIVLINEAKLPVQYRQKQ